MDIVTDEDIELFEKSIEDIIITEKMLHVMIIKLCREVQFLEKRNKQLLTEKAYYKGSLEELEILYDDMKN
tara:strand:+ start:48 stop:260 length:213 start_codon:yes stop_codon:yes gene_type:complete